MRKMPFLILDQLTPDDWQHVEATRFDGVTICLSFRGGTYRKNPQILYWWNQDGITDYKWDIKRFSSHDDAVSFIKAKRA